VSHCFYSPSVSSFVSAACSARKCGGVASIHMLVTIVVFGALIFALSTMGLSLFHGLDLKLSLLIAFALSFSSTVFAVKVLEEKGEMGALHGRVAIGILIIQDIVAVIFLAAVTGKVPSPWALALLALIPLRRPLMMIMDRCGHGELLILYGLFVALGGAEAFELVGLKGDLGALILGVLIASHTKSAELANSLLGFKDLFLVGFFLTIGLYGLPNLEAIGIATLLAVVVVFKVALFYLLLTRFRLRSRTSLFSTLSLANYSEFGLIVGAICVANGWISADWLVIMAIALSITFVIASPLNTATHVIFTKFQDNLKSFETKSRLPEDQPVDPGDAEILVFGMSHFGTVVYDHMREHYGASVVGVDYDANAVQQQKAAGRNVILGDATDPDFWEKLQPGKVKLALLTMPNHAENLFAAKQLVSGDYSVKIATTARFDDERRELQDAGVDAVYDIYDEAATGFAEHVYSQIAP